MSRIARPGVLVRVGDHRGSEGVGFDVSQDRPEVGVVLDRRAFEPTLPNVAEALVLAVIVPGVGDQERLHDATDSDAGLRSQQEVEVVGHEAVAVEAEWEATPSFGQRVQKQAVVVLVVEDELAVVAAAEGVVDQALVIRSK